MVKQNLFHVRQRILSACARVGRDPAGVTLVAVTKNRTVKEIEEAFKAGITDIGENRVQEAFLKHRQFLEGGGDATAVFRDIKWHLIGHLQTNKVREAVAIFDLIHSVDSLRLAWKINKEAGRINKIQKILLEVNASGEASKYGFAPRDLNISIKGLSGLNNLRVCGLMTVAPITDSPEHSRVYFKALKELRDNIDALGLTGCRPGILSMGMTGDFEVAIEEGAGMIRLGRAIFEGQNAG
ncbi:MAG: YggS family pyridoxal phosphate-dependent enzyme [Candidatus Omnitrophota bacterium]|jgi:hypothetical protein